MEHDGERQVAGAAAGERQFHADRQWGPGVPAQAVGNDRMLMCFNRENGALLWQQGVTTRLAKDPTHGTNPYCSASPVTDGRHVIAWFGSDGLHCYDSAARKLWSRDLGVQRHIWGYGASPVTLGDLCFLNFGPGERSFLLAVDKRTGETVWQHDEDSGYGKPVPSNVRGGTNRSSPTYIGSWSTPVPMTVDGRQQLLHHHPGGRLVRVQCQPEIRDSSQ